MHEYSLIKEVIKTVLQEMKEKKLNKIAEVHVKKGHIHGHSSESFINAYESLTKNTVLEGSKLIIEEIHPEAKCGKCNKKIIIDLHDNITPLMECPTCKELVEVKNIPEPKASLWEWIEIKKLVA